MTIRTPRRTTAFTLIELIVAIGAVALIAVGIAAIFQSIGRTVSGGRRLSVLNQYAALIERQMRADFEAMTRDGVLLIRNQYANERGPVQLSVDDPNPRPRRVDELLFFARGQFSSARSPVIPGFNALSSEAMVYYGHGIRLHPLEDLGGKSIGGNRVRYERPQVNDSSEADARPYRKELTLGNPDSSNPNRFAADWALLRKVAVLAPPGTGDRNLPSSSEQIWRDLGLDRTEALDSDIQIGGQPAVVSPFRTLAELFPADYPWPPAPYIRGSHNADQDRRPLIASGIVDVISTDLAEIKRVIMDVDRYPWAIGGELELYDPGDPAASLLDDRYNHNQSGAGSALRFMHAWMDDLFPTDRIDPADPETATRIRYEETLPDFVGTLSTYTDTNTRNYRFIQNLRLADQRVLGAGVFVPRCTEFIVEYSFGQNVEDPSNPYYGQLVWFGMDREVDIDGQLVTVVEPYPFDTTSQDELHYHMPYRKLDGTTADKKVTPQILYAPLQAGEPDVLTAHFGYNDPTYTPSDLDVDTPTIPWPWPKLVRVTMTLADPSDASIEQTFQFIFETPEGRVF